MTRVDWRQVHADDFRVPVDPPLSELTEELTLMLGDADPERRDTLAQATLSTWIARGVYDDLLPGLGDGMAAGLRTGLGENGTDTVFRRSCSALVLAQCIARDNQRPLVLGGKVLQWGDALATWMLRERDLRDWVPDKGWAHCTAHGADALGVLAASPHLGRAELTVLLDVIADRLLAPSDELLAVDGVDRLARAVLVVLRRGTVPMTVLEPWVNRLAVGAAVTAPPLASAAAARGFLRALYLLLALGNRPPAARADLMLVLVGVLRGDDPLLLAGPV